MVWKKVRIDRKDCLRKLVGGMSSSRLEAQRRYRAKYGIKELNKYWRERRLMSLIEQGIITLEET